MKSKYAAVFMELIFLTMVDCDSDRLKWKWNV